MNKKGFTLIELLVVVLIIGILAAIALPQYFKAVEKSRATEALSIMGSLSAAMERARLVNSENNYPTDIDTLDIEFSNPGGDRATGSAWKTKNFDIAVAGTTTTDGKITATRIGSSKYTLARNYYSGQVTCDDTTGAAGAEVKGICASLGITTTTTP